MNVELKFPLVDSLYGTFNSAWLMIMKWGAAGGRRGMRRRDYYFRLALIRPVVC